MVGTHSHVNVHIHEYERESDEEHRCWCCALACVPPTHSRTQLARPRTLPDLSRYVQHVRCVPGYMSFTSEQLVVGACL